MPKGKVRDPRTCLSIAILLGALAATRAPDAVRAGELTVDNIKDLPAHRGIAVVLADDDFELAIDLARRTELLVFTQAPDAAAVDRARRRAARAGLGSRRIQIAEGSWRRLPLARDVANLVIATGRAARELPEAEARRVLAPRGTARLGKREFVEPVPEEYDDWTHPYHGPDNNPLSRDRAIRAPYATRFLAGPRYGPAPQVALSAGGRLFKGFGHVAWHEREEPFLNTLCAFDGFNGTLLWKRPLPAGIMVHRNAFVASEEVLWIGGPEACLRLDATSGKTLGEIRPPREVAGDGFWKWAALDGGVLYALVGQKEPIDETMRWKRKAHGWPWDGISHGFNVPHNPWGYGRHLLALDPTTGAVRWHHEEPAPVDARALALAGGKIFLFRFGATLAAISTESGKEIWRRTPESSPELFRSIGSELGRQSWQTNWRTTSYLKASDRTLYLAGPQVRKLLCLSAEDGRVLWEDAYDNFQLVLRDRELFAISGPWGNNKSRKFDALSGKVLAELPTGRRACTRPTGTADSILYRAMGGTVRFDTERLRPCWISPMRPPCQDGVTVASGALYWWPYACDCQLSLHGVIALTAAGSDLPAAPEPGALELEGSRGAPPGGLVVGERDWPTLRANPRRTATSRARLPEKARILWTWRPDSSVSSRPTAPVAAGGLVFTADTEGVVRALEASSGRERWSATTGSTVRIAPTIWKGRLLVGSGDGRVRALDAATGTPLWRFRAAPRDRVIPVFGQLLSTWPASSGVLVEDGVAYVAAGIANYDGTWLWALDAETGEPRWHNSTSGSLDPVARTGVGVQGHLLMASGKLWLAGGNAVSPAAYDPRDGRCLNDGASLERCQSTSPRGEELYLVGTRVIACGRPFWARPEDPIYDHTVTDKLFWARADRRDVVWVSQQQLGVFKPLKTEWLDRCVSGEKIPRHITQAWGRFRVPEKPLWSAETPGGIALAVAENAVVVATASELTARALEGGTELWKVALPAAPVPWGLAIDREGRVVLTLVDGRTVAVGGS